MKDDALIIGGIALAILGVLWYAKSVAGRAAGAVADAAVAAVPYINPADSRNVVNQGVESIYQATTGSTGSLGTDLYDLLH